MKQEDWTKQLRDKLADHKESAPADLWAGIEARLQQEGVAKSSEKETKRPARLIPLWGKRIAVAAAFIGVITCNGYLMWELGREEMAKKGETSTLEASVAPMKSEDTKVDAPEVPSEGDAIIPSTQHLKQTPLLAQEITPETDETQAVLPEEPQEMQPSEAEKPIPSEKSAKEPQQTLPSEQEQLRLLDAKIAEATKKRQHGRIGFSLYAQGGSGSQMSANGVMMSPTMAANYNYHDQLLSRHFTRTTPNNREIIYLVDYEERQKHYQPISFGLTTNIPISSRLSLTTGLVYTRLRSDFVNIMGGTPLSKEQTLHYLGVPVSAQFKIWGYKGLSVYASAGGQADYNVKAHMEQEGVDYPASRDRWQFSVQAAGGVEYDVIPQLGLYVEPGVKYYFDNGSNVSNFFKDKPTNFNLQVGIRVNLGTQK